MNDYYLRINEPTLLEFYDDPYKKCCVSWIDDRGVSESGEQFLIFSNTVFYPEHHNRIGDSGVILIDTQNMIENINKDIVISKAVLQNNKVLHFIKNDITPEVIEEVLIGNKYEIKIDWNTRYRQMKLHSISNIIESILCDEFGCQDNTFLKYIYGSYGVLKIPKNRYYKKERIIDVFNKVVEFVHGNYEISSHLETNDHNISKRYWICSSYKLICDGVHPYRTNEIKDVALSKRVEGEDIIIYYTCQ